MFPHRTSGRDYSGCERGWALNWERKTGTDYYAHHGATSRDDPRNGHADFRAGLNATALRHLETIRVESFEKFAVYLTEMLCDVCKCNDATVFLTQIQDGKMQK